MPAISTSYRVLITFSLARAPLDGGRGAERVTCHAGSDTTTERYARALRSTPTAFRQFCNRSETGADEDVGSVLCCGMPSGHPPHGEMVIRASRDASPPRAFPSSAARRAARGREGRNVLASRVNESRRGRWEVRSECGRSLRREIVVHHRNGLRRAVARAAKTGSYLP